MSTYLYVHPALESVSLFEAGEFAEMTERHFYRLPVLSLRAVGSVEGEIRSARVGGVVFGVGKGLPNRHQLRLAGVALRNGRAVYFYWTAENAAEVVDAERLASLWRHWAALFAASRASELKYRAHAARYRLRNAVGRVKRSFSREPGALSAAVADNLLGTLANAASALSSQAASLGSARFGFQGINAGMRMIAGRLADLEAALKRAEVEAAREAPLEAVRSAIAEASQHLRAAALNLRGVQGHVEGADGLVARIAGVLAERSRSIQAAYAGVVGSVSLNDPVVSRFQVDLAAFAPLAAAVPFPPGTKPPAPGARLLGTGVYVRTDYWAQLTSGGSYGHTCYVADELAKTTADFVCLMASRFPLLDALGLRQEVLRPEAVTMNEVDLLRADGSYYDALKARFAALRPAYLYERAVLGNFAAARLSRELEIPYLLEYNGSEIAMTRSFGGHPYEHEALFIEAERLAFEQATAISVISDHVRDDVLSRGIDPRKVLVNPNGVNTDEYAPAGEAERRSIRAELGFSDGNCVIGFIGTFGGWHGIDVLAAAMPAICAAAPNARFLLIGDGNLKSMVLEAIRANALQDRVVDVGRTEQRVGARLLKAADLTISPHSSHMKDSPFFGSPTKLFEYMALGKGIVASDLEQIGEVLSPALRPADFEGREPHVGAERAVICRPGDAEDFVAGVLALVRRPDIAAALGRNAREAALRQFSWARHVARLWQHVLDLRQDQSWRKAS